MSNISATGFVIWHLNGFASIFAQAFDKTPTGVCGFGADACPPADFVSYLTSIMPFSAIPISPHGVLTPGKTPSTTAPPSSITSAKLMLFFSK